MKKYPGYIFRSKQKSTLTFLLMILICMMHAQPVQSQTFVHPGIPFTTDDLNQLKINITQEPWLSAYNNFKNDGKSKLSYSMQGPFANVGRAPDLNLGQWRSDMQAVHNLAFMWIFTNDSAYARKATDIMDAWAVTNTQFSGGEMPLELGDNVHFFVTGADILKSTFSGWSAANTTHVNNYFTNLVYVNAAVPNPVKGLNQGALQLKIALSVAAFLNDPIKWNQALDVYRTDAGGGLQCSLPNGQVGDAGRDEGHWFGEADALAWGAEIAWKQRVDLFSEFSNRLYAIGELYTRFHVDTTGLYSNFIPFGGYYAYYTAYGTTGGARRQGLLFNIINGAYSLRKGILTPYSNAYRTIVGESNVSFLYRKTSDTSTASPLTPLVYPITEAVSNLTNIDIGSTGLAGNATYNSGTWTINGAGNSVADVVNFTAKQVTGNVSIIAKFTGSSLTNSVAGVMIRESLVAGAKYVSLNLNKAGGANLSSRGMGGSNAGVHGQPKAPWWLKLERVSGRVTAYHSVDGINWTCIGAYISVLPDIAYIGLYTISNNLSALNTATFTNVSVTNAPPAGSPVITSATQASGVIGSSFDYTIAATNNPSNYSAGGLPAGLTIDAVTGIISGTPTVIGTFMVTINATNANGAGSALLVLKVSSNTAPAAPATLAATIVNTSTIKLTWNASANATTYSVKRSSSPGGPYTTIATDVTGTTYTDAGPVPEVNNYYVVTALAGLLESGVSNEVSKSVPPAIPEKPVIAMQSTQLNLSWVAASGAATYYVKRSSIMGGPYTTIANVAINSYTDGAVSGSNPYYYVISSVGTTLESNNSPEAFGVPGATTITWAQTPSGVTWNQAANWAENYVPASPAIITFKSSTDSVLTNDISNLQVSRILFDGTANAYTLSGNSITLGNDIISNAAVGQAINMPMVLDNPATINTGGNINFNGIITGAGGIEKTGSGVINMNSGNTYAGNTVISGNAGAFPPNNGIGISVIGTGTSGAPTTGALGTGTIIMNGGALFSNGTGNLFLYNNINIAEGKFNYFFQSIGGLYLAGKISGSGTVRNDGNVSSGLHLSGDNSGFTGTFQAFNRSSNHRIRFDNAASGSANASWSLDNRFTDGQGLAFGSGTINFGALTGNGSIRNDASGTAVLGIGALNTNSSFGGNISSSSPSNIINISKTGTGVLIFSGNNTFTGSTTIQSGTFLLNNNAATGTYPSAVTANAGVFGGTGISTAAVTIGTGSGTGGSLEPGNLAIGTFTTTGVLTLKEDATYKVEINTSNNTADKTIAGSVSLVNNPQLNMLALATGTMPVGTSFTIIDNTGAGSVSGIFNGLPELALVTTGGYNFRITYKGGTGNDVVLLDERNVVLPVALTSYTARLQNDGSVLLNWATATERDNAYYTIERNTDGNKFDLISGKIFSMGNSGATYHFIDSKPVSGTNFYRLKQVDKDGNIATLGTKEISINSNKNSWIIYPNPVKGRVVYVKTGDLSGSQNRLVVSLYNTLGSKLFTQTFTLMSAGNTIKINLDKNLPAGNYLLKFNDKNPVSLIIEK